MGGFDCVRLNHRFFLKKSAKYVANFREVRFQ
jgi:hypothetical protein